MILFKLNDRFSIALFFAIMYGSKQVLCKQLCIICSH